MTTDVNELTRIALAASARNDSEGAIASLKAAIAEDDTIALPHYLLGAEYAQIGFIDRAILEMTRAVEADPGLDTARFQLGLLHFTSGRPAEAEAIWAPLAALGTTHPLHLFASGLSHLAADQFAQARDLLIKGIDANVENAALNHDMARLLAEIDRVAALVEQPGGTGDEKPAAEAEHVLVSAYKGQ